MTAKKKPVIQATDPEPIKQRAAEVFASHSVDVLYFTSDGTPFLEPQFARIHAESLQSDAIITIKREEI